MNTVTRSSLNRITGVLLPITPSHKPPRPSPAMAPMRLFKASGWAATWLTNRPAVNDASPPCVPIHNTPRGSRKRLLTVALGSPSFSANEVNRPSFIRARPFCVPIQTVPSCVTASAETKSLGSPSRVVYSVNTPSLRWLSPPP